MEITAIYMEGISLAGEILLCYFERLYKGLLEPRRSFKLIVLLLHVRMSLLLIFCFTRTFESHGEFLQRIGAQRLAGVGRLVTTILPWLKITTPYPICVEIVARLLKAML